MEPNKNSYRYQLIAQNFYRGQSRCALEILDHHNQESLHVSARHVVRDMDFLTQLSPADIRTIIYIDVVEQLDNDRK